MLILGVFSCRNTNGDHYANSEKNKAEMGLPGFYGTVCKMLAAFQVLKLIFEVLMDDNLYHSTAFIDQADGLIKRLAFSGTLLSGHFYIIEYFNNSDIPKSDNKPIKKIYIIENVLL